MIWIGFTSLFFGIALSVKRCYPDLSLCETTATVTVPGVGVISEGANIDCLDNGDQRTRKYDTSTCTGNVSAITVIEANKLEVPCGECKDYASMTGTIHVTDDCSDASIGAFSGVARLGCDDEKLFSVCDGADKVKETQYGNHDCSGVVHGEITYAVGSCERLTEIHYAKVISMVCSETTDSPSTASSAPSSAPSIAPIQPPSSAPSMPSNASSVTHQMVLNWSFVIVAMAVFLLK